MSNKETNRKPIKRMALVLFWVFVVAIYLYTVFFRPTYLVHNARWRLFWSYPLIWRGDRFMLMEVFYNLLMLMPIGLLWPLARNRGRLEERIVRLASRTHIGEQRIDELYLALETTVVGFLCSFGIETLQLFMKRGLFEWDDMLHNTFGSVFGFSLYLIVVRIATREKLRLFDMVWALPFLINCVVLLVCRLHMG